jgi:hypothetical protein
MDHGWFRGWLGYDYHGYTCLIMLITLLMLVYRML